MAAALGAALVLDVGLALLAAPAGASVSASAPDAAVTQDAEEPVATLEILEPSVSVRRAGKQNFKPAKDGQKLRVGDTIQTDGTGFAQINYTDDGQSFTRLDVNTTFTIESLTDDEGNRKIKGNLESGQTWNRTSALTENETFEQEGAGATAAVTGTAFLVSCIDALNCTFTSVIDGIQLTTVDGELQLLDPLEECGATEQDETNSDLCEAPSQVELDALLANQWILENLFLDGTAGFEGIIVVEDGQVVSFTPASTPAATSPPAGDGETPPPPPEVDQDEPITITDPAPDTPTDEIITAENTSVVFSFNVTPSAGTFLTFDTNINDLPGELYYISVAPDNKVNPNQANQYEANQSFTFVADPDVVGDQGPTAFTYVATGPGGTSQQGSVDVTVTDTSVCAEGEVEPTC